LEIKTASVFKTYRFKQNRAGSLKNTIACYVQKLVELSMLVIGQFATFAVCEDSLLNGQVLAL